MEPKSACKWSRTFPLGKQIMPKTFWVGVGLLLCKDFVEKNGGSLEIKAQKGTVVSFTVPLNK
ncbi:MAG: hypothetical protein Tsb0034_28100 [Ekhidna sp.]